jgi:LysM repeat protein
MNRLKKIKNNGGTLQMPHILLKDEKIGDISRFYDVPFSMIQRFNPYVTSEEGIYRDRILTLPTRYTIIPGETYPGIARRIGLTPAQLFQLNPDLNTAVIYPGQTLLLPPSQFRSSGAGIDSAYRQPLYQPNYAYFSPAPYAYRQPVYWNGYYPRQQQFNPYSYPY